MNIQLIKCFDKIVNDKKNEIAVVTEDKRYSFSELKQDAQSVAITIKKLIKSKNVPIAVFLNKSYELVVSNLAILYSGNAYMNLDIKLPDERRNNILDNIKPNLIITSSKYEHLFEGREIILIDNLNKEEETEIFDYTLIDTDPMCIINTSGSTGVPKGVVLNHRSFWDFLLWADEVYKFDNNESIASLSPAVFDIYSFELCLLMFKGAKLILIPDTYAVFPIKIIELLNKEKPTFLFWVPTIMVNIANTDLLRHLSLNSIKRIWFAGEVFPTKQFNMWRRALPNTQFSNLYGPIEITLDCTYYIVDKEINDDDPIPIGKACANTDIMLLTDDNRLATKGEQGEICVRGTSLACGYYNDLEKTSKAFCRNPLNNSYPELIYRTGDMAYENAEGDLCFVGRKDTLIKHNGYRIELSEIEHITVNVANIVNNCCVFYDDKKKHIIMAYEKSDKVDNKSVLIELKKYLPKYMLPTQLITVDNMPMNTNGKIDRLKIKELYERGIL